MSTVIIRDRAGGAAKAGIGFGSALAITISWSVNHSVIWAIVQGIFSWFYVLYYVLTRPGGIWG